MTNHLFDGLLADANRSARLASFEDRTNWTYGDLIDASGRMANALVALGVTPGDRVAVQVPKSIEAIALYLGCLRVGAVFLPLNTAYLADELTYFISDAGAAVFVCDPERAAELAPIANNENAVLVSLGAQGDGTLAKLASDNDCTFSNVARGPDDLAAILYTSGTTGRSKGAMQTHDNLLSNAKALVDLWQFTKSDVLFHALPIFHTHGLFVATNVVMLSGGSMIFLPGFSVDRAIAHLPKATSMMGVPTFYTRLLDDPRFTSDLVAHMRVFISGSAPLLAETHLAFENLTGQRILERYGMSESGMITSNPYDAERRAGTVGFALPGVSIRICEEKTGKPVPAGEIGILETKGPNLFKGYWNMPEKTAEEHREDGFFITGDLAREDADGYVQIVGRSKDLIISGGYNIYPKEVELLLDEQDGVLETAVIGVPHSDFGEGVVGVVVATDPALTADSLMAAIRDRIARFKQPKHIAFLPELPRNTMGKVQKNVLRDQFAGVFKPEN